MKNGNDFDYPCEQTVNGKHKPITKPVHPETKDGYCQYPYGEHEDDKDEQKVELELFYHLIDGTDYLDYRNPMYFCKSCIEKYNLGVF